MFNIVKHCQSQRENSCVNYNKLKTATNDPSITRKKRFAQLMRAPKVGRVHNFKEAQSLGAINIASQGTYTDDYPSYRYSSGQVFRFVGVFNTASESNTTTTNNSSTSNTNNNTSSNNNSSTSNTNNNSTSSNNNEGY